VPGSAPAATRCTWTCRLNSYRGRVHEFYDTCGPAAVIRAGRAVHFFLVPGKTPMMCAEMPPHAISPSKDEGASMTLYVHSHRFPGANTAVPVAE